MICTRLANKAMKYGIWTSARQNNMKFENAFVKNNVYFFFTPRNSGRFYGMAKMTKSVIEKKEFAYWGEIGKWKELFGVEWLIVKDLYFNELDHMSENDLPISELRDGYEISPNNAKEIIAKFDEIAVKSDIFTRFANLDKKEKDIRSKADAMIMTGMYDIYAKEHEEKKKQYLQQIKDKSDVPKEEPVPVVIVKKKLTQGQKKKMMKQQEKGNQ